MFNKVFSYENSKSLDDAKIVFYNNKEMENISISQLIPTDFFRKTILNIEVVNEFEQSTIRYKRNNISLKKSKKIKSIENTSISICLKDNPIGINELIPQDIDYEFNFFISIDTPLIAKKDEYKNQSEIIKNSEILNIYLIFVLNNSEKKTSNKNHQVYESYGELGFVIADINKINQFIKEQHIKISNDLFKEFTTTELASELFDAGLMLLCWGMTPWPYYIMSNDKDNKAIQPFIGEKTKYSGSYKFSSEIQEASIIPGNALRDWSSCSKDSWPTIEIPGIDDTVNIELYILNAKSDDSLSSIPIPTFLIERTDKKDFISPLLESRLF